MARNNGNKAIPQSTLLTKPSFFTPTLEKMPLKERCFSQTARKMMRKTRKTPPFITILNNKFKTRKIVMSCGNVCFDEPTNATRMAKYRVKKNHRMNGPFTSPNFFDAIV